MSELLTKKPLLTSEGIFSYGDEYVDKYINEFGKKSLLSATQLGLVLGTSIDTLDSILKMYSNYLGSACGILESLIKVLEADEKDNSVCADFSKYYMVTTDKNLPLALRNLAANGIARLFRICKGDVSDFKLDKLQTSPISNEQKEEIQDFLLEHLKNTVDTVKSYQNVFRVKGKFYYDFEKENQTNKRKGVYTNSPDAKVIHLDSGNAVVKAR